MRVWVLVGPHGRPPHFNYENALTTSVISHVGVTVNQLALRHSRRSNYANYANSVIQLRQLSYPNEPFLDTPNGEFLGDPTLTPSPSNMQLVEVTGSLAAAVSL